MSEKQILNPVAQEAPGLELKIFKHHLSTRIMHACVAFGCLYCAVTGFLLFFGAPIPRAFVAISHCLMGLLFFIAPVVYIAINYDSFARFMNTIFTYDKDDLGWIKAPMGGYLDPYLFKNKPPHYVPPQDKYNTGQKLAGICMVAFALIIAVTGVLMWANSGDGILGLIKLDIGSGATQLIWTLHLGAAVLLCLVLVVHIFLGAIYKETRVEFGTMFGNGIADYAYTKKKHGKWIETLAVKEELHVEDEADGRGASKA